MFVVNVGLGDVLRVDLCSAEVSLHAHSRPADDQPHAPAEAAAAVSSVVAPPRIDSSDRISPPLPLQRASGSFGTTLKPRAAILGGALHPVLPELEDINEADGPSLLAPPRRLTTTAATR